MLLVNVAQIIFDIYLHVHVQVDGRLDGHVITKTFHIYRLQFFLTHGAPHVRELCYSFVLS